MRTAPQVAGTTPQVVRMATQVVRTALQLVRMAPARTARVSRPVPVGDMPNCAYDPFRKPWLCPVLK